MSDTAAETGHLIALMARHGIGTFEYRDGERALRIVNGVMEEGAEPVELPPAPDSAASISYARSPAVGRFQRAGEAVMPRTVARGEIIGFVTSGLLRLPVTAPDDGELLSVCHPDETPVGYDTALFEYRKTM